ncbi:MAG: GDSL-type esterase/lipase family protein [Bacteroidales bacterium]|nr:GDSL-type esterase/lipase family protein [Bacteroidales bacterium]
MKKYFLIISLLCIISSCCQNNNTQNVKQQIKIACIGNSITEGHGISDQSKYTWPVQLNKILGDEYIVENCGRSGTTLQKEGDYTYWTTKEFSNAILLNPDIIVVKLGTNDSKPQNWNQERFKSDYQSLIDTLKSLKSNPRIIICNPAPAFGNAWAISDSCIVNGIIPIIENIAKQNNLELIDFHSELINDGDNFPDSIHPNDKEAEKIAQIVAKKILNK